MWGPSPGGVKRNGPWQIGKIYTKMKAFIFKLKKTKQNTMYLFYEKTKTKKPWMPQNNKE